MTLSKSPYICWLFWQCPCMAKLEKIQPHSFLGSSHLASGWIRLVQSVRGCFGYFFKKSLVFWCLLHVLYGVYWLDRIRTIESISRLKQTLHLSRGCQQNPGPERALKLCKFHLEQGCQPIEICECHVWVHMSWLDFFLSSWYFGVRSQPFGMVWLCLVHVWFSRWGPTDQRKLASASWSWSVSAMFSFWVRDWNHKWRDAFTWTRFRNRFFQTRQIKQQQQQQQQQKQQQPCNGGILAKTLANIGKHY